MARPKSASHDLKRDAILDLAARCFAERSYHAASMNDIAEAGGTSKARLYHYYESKEAILFDLLDRHTQRLLAIVGDEPIMRVERHTCIQPGDYAVQSLWDIVAPRLHGFAEHPSFSF